MKEIRVTHVITGLGTGGAETMLVKLLSACGKHIKSEVISLNGRGPLADTIESLGVPVYAVKLGGARSVVTGMSNIIRHLKKSNPDLVQTWMYHADLIGGLAARLAGIRRVVWNLRASNLDAEKLSTRLIQSHINAPLSHYLPRAIVCCGEQVRRIHEALGYSASKLLVIPNGFDVQRFRPEPAAGQDIRTSLRVPPDALVVGTVGRLHPMKDYPTFFAAAALVSRHFPVHFVLAGAGLEPSNEQVRKWIEGAGLTGRVHLLGVRNDLERVYNSMDVFLLSSRGEGFPNVLGEAMSCGVPCIATDVGDSRIIIGDTGKVVPPGDHEALAAATVSLLSLTKDARTKLGAQARTRILERFSIAKVTDRYLSLYEQLTQ